MMIAEPVQVDLWGNEAEAWHSARFEVRLVSDEYAGVTRVLVPYHVMSGWNVASCAEVLISIMHRDCSVAAGVACGGGLSRESVIAWMRHHMATDHAGA